MGTFTRISGGTQIQRFSILNPCNPSWTASNLLFNVNSCLMPPNNLSFLEFFLVNKDQHWPKPCFYIFSHWCQECSIKIRMKGWNKGWGIARRIWLAWHMRHTRASCRVAWTWHNSDPCSCSLNVWQDQKLIY